MSAVELAAFSIAVAVAFAIFVIVREISDR
jgi:hypothetical protein